jgi:hypothetical protein
MRRAFGSQSALTMEAADALALADVSQGKFAAGEPLARETFDFYRKKTPDEWQRFHAESLMGETLAGQKKYQEVR